LVTALNSRLARCSSCAGPAPTALLYRFSQDHIVEGAQRRVQFGRRPRYLVVDRADQQRLVQGQQAQDQRPVTAFKFCLHPVQRHQPLLHQGGGFIYLGQGVQRVVAADAECQVRGVWRRSPPLLGHIRGGVAIDACRLACQAGGNVCLTWSIAAGPPALQAA